MNSTQEKKPSFCKSQFKVLIFWITIISFLFNGNNLYAQIKLPHIFSDSMVLQRDQSVKIWGWASPNERVTVSFLNKNYKTRADKQGNWKLQLHATKAGGPFTMTFSGKNKIVLNQILVGDVWFASGQSNMEHQMKLHNIRYKKEIESANYPQIRQFAVPRATNLLHPEKDIAGGRWIAANPQTVNDFSAVAYFFAKALYERYKIPIGIINNAVGGSPIEAWMSEESLQKYPQIMEKINRNKDTAFVTANNRKAALENTYPDQNDDGLSQRWYDRSLNSLAGWKPINIPGYWEDQGVKNLDGIVWYKNEITLPASFENGTAFLSMGRIVDADQVYINGKKVGQTTYMYPQRRYQIPANILKNGMNDITIRVVNYGGKGGFISDKPYYLANETDTVDLKGYWQYKVAKAFEPLPKNRTQSINLLYQPTALYNAMLAPLEGYNIKGFIWYQGESNTNAPVLYGQLQAEMIAGRREKWGQPDAPFLYVQLPGFMDMSYLPEESNWAQFRFTQLKGLSVPYTGMAVAIDLGEWNDIHPDRKKPVGDRLALQARKIAYGESGVFSGPIYRSQKIVGGKIELAFSNIGSGLMTNDGQPLSEFEIAGADGKYVNAQAEIKDDKVIVWSEKISDPVSVRYAWSDCPVNPNLFNKEGLPASPFETKE